MVSSMTLQNQSCSSTPSSRRQMSNARDGKAEPHNSIFLLWILKRGEGGVVAILKAYSLHFQSCAAVLVGTHTCLPEVKTKKELTASMVTSLVSWSFPPLPQSHLGGHVAFVRVVYFPPNRACAYARPSILRTGLLLCLHIHITSEDRSLWGLKWS